MAEKVIRYMEEKLRQKVRPLPPHSLTPPRSLPLALLLKSGPPAPWLGCAWAHLPCRPANRAVCVVCVYDA
jgi:hypothetical protein